jgi:hypothetical protein
LIKEGKRRACIDDKQQFAAIFHTERQQNEISMTSAVVKQDVGGQLRANRAGRRAGGEENKADRSEDYGGTFHKVCKVLSS